MSGKRQHFIPRFLQEGFASHRVGNATFTWVYRKGAAAFNTNIINVGVERLFYTDNDGTQADDLITDGEGVFSRTVDKLRSITHGPVTDTEIPRLIAHLEIRTRHMRENLLRTGGFIVSAFLDFMSDERAFIDYLEREFRNDPSILRKLFLDELANRGLPDSLLEPFLQLSSPLLPLAMDHIRSQLPKIAEELRSTLPNKLKAAAKSGHIQSLRKTISPELRIRRYESLIYSVLGTSDNNLVLGDSAVLFLVDGSSPFKAILDSDDVINAIILPLTPRSALVGAGKGFSEIPANINRAIARCSLEYFIAAESSGANDTLKDQIGDDAYLLTQEELENIVEELKSR